MQILLNLIGGNGPSDGSPNLSLARSTKDLAGALAVDPDLASQLLERVGNEKQCRCRDARRHYAFSNLSG